MTFSYLDSNMWGQSIYGDVPIAISCSHEFVNVSFAHIKMVCKKCDVEKPEVE